MHCLKRIVFVLFCFVFILIRGLVYFGERVCVGGLSFFLLCLNSVGGTMHNIFNGVGLGYAARYSAGASVLETLL